VCKRERRDERRFSRIGGNGGGDEHVWGVMTCNPIMARSSKGE